jgi:hypothetical protein
MHVRRFPLGAAWVREWTGPVGAMLHGERVAKALEKEVHEDAREIGGVG